MTPANHQVRTDGPSHAPELRAAARQLGRRRFLTVTGAAAALAFSVNLPAAGSAELGAAAVRVDALHS
ncbi:hypothetical protein [Streptomyces sp. NPDC045251]|uniref:hypothetical protein n=1 Tax=unclassified Streptomyces TaxID=2593676 RepID=UPI0033C012C6